MWRLATGVSCGALALYAAQRGRGPKAVPVSEPAAAVGRVVVGMVAHSRGLKRFELLERAAVVVRHDGTIAYVGGAETAECREACRAVAAGGGLERTELPVPPRPSPPSACGRR